MPYLLRLNKALPKAVWNDDGKPKKTDRIPAAERFTFCLNTLLSDIAVNCPEKRDEIVSNQVETLNTLTNMIKSNRETGALPPINLCKATVPILLGLGRSMGRYTYNSPPLLCRIFPPIKIPIISNPLQTNANPIHLERQPSLSQFRSIIPRSLSGGLSCEALDDSLSDEADSPNRNPNKKLQSYPSVPYDTTTHFFSKYGSSFNQFQNMRTYDTPEKRSKIQFTTRHLQEIFAIAKKLLTKEFLEHLDEQASDIFALHQIQSYEYKSFSETINLVLVTLLRDVLQSQNGEFWAFFFLRQISENHIGMGSRFLFVQIYPIHSPTMYKSS